MKKLLFILLLTGCAQTVPMDPHQCYFDPQYHTYVHHNGCVEHIEYIERPPHKHHWRHPHER